MPYDLWYAELDKPMPEARRADRSTEPSEMLGFWRIIGARTKPDYPVSIWQEDGQEVVIFQIGRKLMNTAEHAREWADFVSLGAWLSTVAVSREAWDAALTSGRWQDGKPSRRLTDAEKLDIIPDTPAEQGGNMPADEAVDSFHEQVTSKIAALLEKAAAVKKIEKLDEANAVAEIVEPLRALGKQGEARRKEEKQPHMDAAQAVDSKWRIIRDASDAVTRLVDMVDRWKRAEEARLRRERDEEQRRERERIAAEERARLEEEARQRAAQASEQGDAVELPSEEEIAAQAEQNAADQVAEQEADKPPVEAPRVGTAYGRAISKPTKRAARIVDPGLFLRFISGAADDAAFADFDQWVDGDVKAAMQKQANALARAKTKAPGLEIE